jgi:limonene-1,2-epoxide hydrolase
MMRKRTIPVIAAIFILVVPVILMTGCPLHNDSFYGARVTGDGSGGAVAVYEDISGGNIYVQKISADGKTVWGERGVFLGNTGSQVYSYFSFDIVYDGAGGAIVVRPDSSQNKIQFTYHISRINADGKVIWQRDFGYFKKMVSDGSGGVIVCCNNPSGQNIASSDSQNLVVVKIDSEGNYPWGTTGITVPLHGYQDNTLQITADGSGGAIIVWQELQSQPTSTPGNPNVTDRLFAQRIDTNGRMPWGDSRLLYTTPENTYAESPQIAGDGSGGAIFGWQQTVNGRIESGSPQAQMMDILVQKINSSGNVMWGSNGLPLQISATAVNATPIEPLITDDNTGGEIVIWRDHRDLTAGSAGIYAQNVDAGGHLKWQAGGIKVSATSLNPNPLIISSGSGGSIIVYSYQEDWRILNAQKLGSGGQALWPENGITITRDGFAGKSIVSDGQGGIIAAWGLSKSGAYVQRLNADGRLLWGEKGIKLGKK